MKISKRDLASLKRWRVLISGPRAKYWRSTYQYARWASSKAGRRAMDWFMTPAGQEWNIGQRSKVGQDVAGLVRDLNERK